MQQPQKSSPVFSYLVLIAIIIALFYFGPSLGLGKAVSRSLANTGKSLTSSVDQLGANEQAGNSYRSVAWNDAQSVGIPAQLFINQINDESGFNPTVVSRAGAIGIAQIMPATARSWNVNPYDPIASLKAAAQHMAVYYRDNNNDYAKALAAYNAGSGGLQHALDCGASWRSCLPNETQQYIAAVMGR